MGLDHTPSRTAGAGHTGGGGRFAARLAWALAALSVSCGAVFLILLAVNSRNPDVATYEYWGAGAVSAIVFPVVGAVIVNRHPRNTLGWIMCLIGICSGLSGVALEYASYAFAATPAPPGAEVAAWLDEWVGLPGFVSLALLPLLFPDGRPPSRRWNPLVWAAAACIAASTAFLALMPGPLGRYPSVENPFGVEGARGVLEPLLTVTALVLAATLFAGIASLVVRYRRSRDVERRQIKWFVFAAAALPLALLGNDLFPSLSWLIGGVGVACIPAAIGVAILKHNLYDIDLVINRTLVYGTLTAMVVGIYALVVGGLGAAFQARGDILPSILAAGIVAVLFAPLRDRLQRAVNRLMYGERDDPYRVLSRLGERLEGTLSPGAVLPAVVETVATTLKLPHAGISLKREGGFETAAEHGTPSGEPLMLPLVYQKETVGRLVLSPRSPGEAFTKADVRLLEDLARQAGVAAHAVRLAKDLQRSRERLVATREEERRRLRRDFHDGIGPRLAALTLKLETAKNKLSQNPEADALLSDLAELSREAVADARRAVHGLRPPALDEIGLAAALRETAAQYSQNGLRISVEAKEAPTHLPAAVEVAAYHIAREAMTNVVRHAGARECAVRVSLERDALRLEISDDGRGIGEGFASGVGLRSMRERAEELGGECGIEAVPSGGTLVSATLPLEVSGFRFQASGKSEDPKLASDSGNAARLEREAPCAAREIWDDETSRHQNPKPEA